MVTCTGFEPVNACVKGMWVNRFSNRPNQWWFRPESNQRHEDFQSSALPTELRNHWRSGRDSNPRPPPWQGGILTNWTTRPMVAGEGFEPTTFGLWARRATRLLHPAILKKEDKRFELLRGLTHLTVFKTVPFSQTWVILHNKSYLQFLTRNHNGPCRTRTYDRTVMSRLL